jgi:hypothetical protein
LSIGTFCSQEKNFQNILDRIYNNYIIILYTGIGYMDSEIGVSIIFEKEKENEEIFFIVSCCPLCIREI